jgi:hypothetical protein
VDIAFHNAAGELSLVRFINLISSAKGILGKVTFCTITAALIRLEERISVVVFDSSCSLTSLGVED